VTGLVARRRQRPRRRITPNTNTSTTTMISTHNHVDMAVSLVGGRRRTVRGDATAAHPGKQLGHGQATSRAGRLPARQPTTRRPGGAEPFGPLPASPAATVSTGTTRAEDPDRRQPSQHDHGEPDRRGMARSSSVCPAWVGEQCEHGCAETRWQTPRRRRRTDGSRLWRNPNVRRGRLRRPALPVQPRSALRDPPRLGPAAGDSAAATLPLSCREEWSARLGRLALLRASASKELPSRPSRRGRFSEDRS
jgi:hypothetical protein